MSETSATRLQSNAESLLASVVASSDDAIISLTLEGIVTSWNAAAERIFGYTAEEAIGRSIYVILPPERYEEEATLLARLARGDRIAHFETVRVAKDGRRIDISLTVSPVRDRSGRIIGASKVARDISQQREAAEALRTADRRKDEFLATLAHELRNPLAPIRNAVEIAKRAQTNPALTAQAHATMDRQLAHLERLVDDLLDISRITSDKLELRQEPVELATIIAQAVESCRPLAESQRHKLDVRMLAEPVYVFGDTVRLTQVFGNIINNACKYTQSGGSIAVQAAVCDGTVTVAIRDTGAGIPPELLPNIFDMFVQVDNSSSSRGGLGIGLALVRRLVQMHGGNVTAHSAGPGRGSEFAVTLPLYRGPIDTTVESSDAKVPMKSFRILVVDDNVDAAESLMLLLNMSGYEARMVHDGRSAVETAEEFRPDVILLDIGMPALNGHDAARMIRQQPGGKDMILVALTGWGQAEDRRKSQAAGIDHHLVKPVNVDALLALLSRVAASRERAE